MPRHRSLGAWLLGLVLLSSCLLQTAWAQSCSPTISAVQAARENPGDAGRPTQGWEPVTLPDIWTTRWPDFTGAVWYRISWRHDCVATGAEKPLIALVSSSINLAGEVYLNDTLLWRDASLQEPLSRSWNTPRYWILPDAALRPQANDIWIRVQGRALVFPGLGLVRMGPPAQMLALHQQLWWSQRTTFLINMVGSLCIAGLFAGIWLLYRKQALYGWFALLNLAWVLFVYNIVAVDPWPFSHTADMARANAIAFMAFCMCYAIFIFQLQGRALSRVQERSLQALTVSLSLVIVCIPEKHLLAAMQFGVRTHLLVFAASCIMPLVHAWRSRKLQDVFYASLGLGFVIIALYDTRTYYLKIPDPVLLTPYANLVTMAVITAVLGSRIAHSMRRTERFNVELSNAVEEACRELETTLGNEHQLELSNLRLQERLQFIHDLHDGFGSALVRAIVQAERNADAHADAPRHISTLKSLRDDLRNVMGSGERANAELPATPSEWMAPTRHRFSTLFDEMDVTSRWSCLAVWPWPPSVAFCMELTRLLEEALSNVLKHSEATAVEITLAVVADRELTLEVRDNGVGFDLPAVSQAATGIGLASMQARITRLGGTLLVESRPGLSLIRASLTH